MKASVTHLMGREIPGHFDGLFVSYGCDGALDWGNSAILSVAVAVNRIFGQEPRDFELVQIQGEVDKYRVDGAPGFPFMESMDVGSRFP